MGLALFRKNKLIGELNGLETICHLIVSGDLNSCKIQVPNPKSPESNMDINLKLDGHPSIKVTLINGFPFIELNIGLNIRILTINKNIDYSNKVTSDLIETEVNNYMKSLILNYLYKVCKEYNCDIDGFGKYAMKYFPTIDEWNKYDWLNNYKNSFFNVSINSKIRSGYSFINI